MTNPAGVDVDAHLRGVDPGNGGVLAYQAVPVLARTIYSNYDGRQPFYTNYGKGNVANSAATYDAVTGAALQTASRHIDPYGNATELHKISLLLHYWLLDGAPTNMGAIGAATNRIPLYIRLANQLRPWPVGFAGAAAGEPTQAYPAFPPTVATPLDTFTAQASTRDVAKAHAAFRNVAPVVRHHKPRRQADISHALQHMHQSESGAGRFGIGGMLADPRLTPQFTPQAGPEHYAAAGHGWNPTDELLQPIPQEYRLPPADNTMKTFAPPMDNDPRSPMDQVLAKLESIEARLSRAGL